MSPADPLLQALPQLTPGVERRTNEAGDAVLVGKRSRQYMGLEEGDEDLIGLLDGTRTLEQVLKDALALPIPVRPLAVLSLLRRLRRAQLVDGLDEVEANLFEDDEQTPGGFFSRTLWWLASVSVVLPGTAFLARAGAAAPRRLWTLGGKVALGFFAFALLAAVATGKLGVLLDPFAGPHVSMRAATLYLAASLLLSMRGLAGGLALVGHGLQAGALRLRVLVGVLHLDFDDRERRAAPRVARVAVAWTCLGALGLGAASATLVWLSLGGAPGGVAHALASMGVYLLLADAMPYGRGSGWHLAGIVTGIPGLRRRSASFLLRRAVRNLLRSEPIGPTERVYLRVASAWLLHAVLSLLLLAEYVLPGTLRSVMETARHPLSGHPLAATSSFLTLAATAALLLLLLGLCAGLALLVGAWIAQLARVEPSRPPRHSEPIGDRAEMLLDEMKRVPFLANLDPEELLGMVAGMRRETHADGDLIVKQGELGDRFCLLYSGHADVICEEESGLTHVLARLQEGDFFGEIALLSDVARTATVRAAGEAVVLTLDRETFVALVERSGFPREAVMEQVRNAAFLRTVPVFRNLGAELMGRLLQRVKVQRRKAGETVVTQGEAGDAMYVIREGQCEVLRRPAGAAEQVQTELKIDTLGPGDFFGEIALMRGVKRTATVRVTAEATLVQVPAALLDEVLMDDVRAGMALKQCVARRLTALETS